MAVRGAVGSSRRSGPAEKESAHYADKNKNVRREAPKDGGKHAAARTKSSAESAKLAPRRDGRRFIWPFQSESPARNADRAVTTALVSRMRVSAAFDSSQSVCTYPPRLLASLRCCESVHKECILLCITSSSMSPAAYPSKEHR